MSDPASRPRMPDYKGEELDEARGPGLGCFWFQVVLLLVFVIVTPLTVGRVPTEVSAILLFVVIGLLLFVGQTMIFLLRLVAADRRGRRRPLASRTRTVGELEDAARQETDAAAAPRTTEGSAASPVPGSGPGHADDDGESRS